jgi:hypothetical protein
MDSSIILLFAIVIVVGAILFAVITLGKRSSNLDVEKYRVWWLDIEQSLKRDDPTSYHMAILDADKLVDHALREKGFSGKTMGERLKATRGQLSDRDSIWFAHKLRNRIAHEPGVKVNYNQARRALAGFKRALKDLGAI